MKLLIDTNVVLDLILKREPFYQNAIDVLSLAKRDDVQEMDGIVTRNPKDYEKTEIQVFTPEEILNKIK
jgi:hypothetical protein